MSYRISILLAALILTAGCRPSESSQTADARLYIVCTTTQVGDLIAVLAGDRCRVETLMGPGVDPHLKKATLGDNRKLSSADAIFYSGLHLEGRMSDTLESLSKRKPVFAVVDRVLKDQPDRLRRSSVQGTTFDPHFWFDVRLWIESTRYAAECLAEIDPPHAAEYRSASKRYVTELETLDEECRDRLAKIPASSRVMVTAHDAFEYFGHAYGLEVHGLQGISTVDEADLKSFGGIVRLLVSRKIKAVFVESSVSPKNIQSLIDACAAQGHQLKLGGELYSDAMGNPGTPEGTYLGMMRKNLATLYAALE